MSVRGIILKAGYSLRRHRIGPIPIGYAPLILAAGTLIAAIAHLLTWPWAVGVMTVALALTVVVRLIGRQGYIIFHARSFAPLQVAPPQVDEKVEGRASGYFEVGGKRRYFVESLTYFSTVETREHILMARIPHTRFLLIATSPRDEVGWWYVFFHPRMVQAVRTGEIHFGMRPRPALQVTYQADNSSAQTVYLSFDDVTSLQRVLSDLQLDADLP
jgi:hypothetical protein